MKYPNVRNSHIVPKSYLRNFSINGKTEVHTVGQVGSMVRPIEKAAVRLRYYRRTRPDGTKIDDIEWSLSHSENKAAPILRNLDSIWPLPSKEKAVLAELFAYQAIRGPRWMAWREEKTCAWIAELRAHPEEMDAGDGRDPQEAIDELEQHLLGDTQQFMQMLEVGPKLASALGSMHWTLVEFRSPLVATSDHPVVIWPGGEASQRPQPASPTGFLETLEVRVPVSPTAVILMTWLDVADDAQPRVRGTRDHAANVNAFTVAQAERQWFHLPGKTPPRAIGLLLPVAPGLVKGYSRAVAAQSARRKRASDIIQPLIGKPTQGWFEMVIAA